VRWQRESNCFFVLKINYMAKNRMINTKFWSDGWIIELNPLERYLFLYLLTNEHTNICGIYELPVRVIARESGIDDDMVLKMIKKMSDKIIYVDGWICIKNFLKHQKASGNVKLGVENGKKDIPSDILAKIKELLDTPPCVGGHSPILELKSELELEGKGVSDNTPSQAFLNFISSKEEQRKFIDTAIKGGWSEITALQEIDKFIDYWTEPTKSGKKQRWETEKVFEHRRRLSTWFRNAEKFNNK
jgi:hypothetical protein